MNRNKYVRDYTDAIKNLLPQMTEDEGNGILSGKLKIDSFLEELGKFDKNVSKGITAKYMALFQGLLLNHNYKLLVLYQRNISFDAGTDRFKNCKFS